MYYPLPTFDPISATQIDSRHRRGSYETTCVVASFSILFGFLFSYPAWADDDQNHPHHEDLNETQLGTVHFPVSCAAAVQKPFERGVALLHSFWYEEAEKEFEQIAKDDPHCAMAHWGVAMSLWHQLWNNPDEKVIARGLDETKKAAQGKTTPREQAYIAAMRAFYSNSEKLDHDACARAYSDAMKKVYEAYPDDHEAAVFYALSLLASEPHEDTTFANRKQAAAILEKLFATEPDHPGVAHYLIHAYDKPQLAQLGLPAARRYAQVAPAAPHALHMPSHIFARVGLWQDDINSNLASIAATRKTAAMHMGGEGHQFHAMDFLVYAYLQSGRESDAAKVIEEVRTMSHMESMYGPEFDPQTYALSEFPAVYDLELHHWADAAALQVVPGALRGDQAITYWARAIGSARGGNLAQAHKDLDEIDEPSARSSWRERKCSTPRSRENNIRKPRPGSRTPKAKMTRPLPACVLWPIRTTIWRGAAGDSGARDARRHAAGGKASAAGPGGVPDGFEAESESLQRTLWCSPRRRRSRPTRKMPRNTTRCCSKSATDQNSTRPELSRAKESGGAQVNPEHLGSSASVGQQTSWTWVDFQPVSGWYKRGI